MMEKSLESMKKKSNGFIDMYYGGSPKNIFVKADTKDIITYTYDEVDVNNFEKIDKMQSFTCKEFIEGTVISIFFCQDQWIISTSSFLNADECHWKSDKSILSLAKECVDDWSIFLENHDKEYIYMYTLVHHDNIHLIDYSYLYGPMYKELCLFMKRHIQTNKVEMIIDNEIKYDILLSWNEKDKHIKESNMIEHAGLVIIDNENNNIVKILTESYGIVSMNKKFHTVNSFSYFNQLYRQNQLNIYFNRFPSERYWKGRNIFILIKNMYVSLSLQINDFLLCDHTDETLCLIQKKIHTKLSNTDNKNIIGALKSLNDQQLLYLISVSKKKQFDNLLLYIHKE